jgi:hypothetical protein
MAEDATALSLRGNWSASVPDYRAYPLLGNARIAALRIDFVARTDTEALDRATRLARGHRIEVWKGARRIGFVRGIEDVPPS